MRYDCDMKKGSPSETIETLNFEAALNELETVIEKMETGQLSLEDSLKSFEQGVNLARTCQKALKEAEQKVQILIEKNGELYTEPFNTEDQIES